MNEWLESDTSAEPPDYKEALFPQAVRLLNSTSVLNIAISLIFYDSLINSLSISFQRLEKRTIHSILRQGRQSNKGKRGSGFIHLST